MVSFTRKPLDWEFLLGENNGDYAREQITLISGQNLDAGTVLGRITASGLYTIHNPGASDGSQNAAAILGARTDATSGNTRTAGIVGGPGISVEVNGALLTFITGISAPNRAAAITALAGLGIKVR